MRKRQKSLKQALQPTFGALRRRIFREQKDTSPVWESFPKLLSIRQTADLLRVHPNTLREWDRRGSLRAVRLGTRRDRRYEKEAVRAQWAERQKVSLVARVKPHARRHLRPAAVAAGITLALVSLVQVSSVAAQQPVSDTLSYRATECGGWPGATQALLINVRSGADPHQFSEENSAYFSSDFAAVTGNLSGNQIVTSGLDQTSQELTCHGYATAAVTPGTVFESASLRVSLTSRAELNSSDSFVLEASLDGQHWDLLTAIAAGAPPPEHLNLNLPTLTSFDALAKLELRVRPEGDFGQPLEAWVDGLEVFVRTETPAPVTDRQVRSANSQLDQLTGFSQESYRATEQPILRAPKKKTEKFLWFFTARETTWETEQVVAVDAAGREFELSYRVTEVVDGEDLFNSIRLDTRALHPGRYTLKLTSVSSEGVTSTVEKEFLWGVAAINVTHAVAKPGIEQVIGMGVLDDAGVTICDAEIVLTVTDPKGRADRYSTDAGSVQRNDKCVDKGVTNLPDYSVRYRVETAGVYHLRMEATTRAGKRVVEETFQSDPGVAFDVDRFDYPTRIYPPAKYPVRIAITPQRDFVGVVRENMPADFVLEEVFPGATIFPDPDDTSRVIIEWNVEWKGGETYFVGYRFDAPDISPALFLAGPMSIGGDAIRGSEFTEPRQWQIASDAVTANGNIYYGDTTNAGKLKMTPFTSPSTYGGELNINLGPTVNIMHVEAKTAPTREEKMIGFISGNPTTDGRLDIVTGTTGFEAAGDYTLRWTATSVTNAQDCDSAPTADTCIQPFGVAYEQLSGRGMVVYAGDADASAAPDADKIYYAFWDSSAWSPDSSPNTPSATNELSLPGTGGTPQWIRVIAAGDNLADDRTNRAMVLVSDTDEDLYAFYWDGSTFDGGTELYTTLGNCSTARCFDGNWQGNNTFIVSYTNNGVNEVRYQKYTVGSGWGSDTQAYTTSATPAYIISAADPTSSRILSGNFTTGNDTRSAVWRGDNATDGWTVCASGGCPDTASEAAGGPQMSVAFERFNGEGLHIFNDAANGTTQGNKYMTYAQPSTWGSATVTGITPTDDQQFTKAIQSPNSDDIMIIAGDVDCDVDAVAWTGAGFGTVGSNFELLLSSSNGSCANSVPIANMMSTGGIDFAWNIYSPWGLNWRFTGDTSNATPGSWLANENTVPTGIADATTYRLRYGFVNRGTTSQVLSAEGRKKLQYTTDSPDSLTATWTDVDADDGAGIWRYNNCTSGTDDSAIPSAQLTAPSGGSNEVGDFIEGSGNITQTHSAGPAVATENDYCIESNGVGSLTTYYFRAYDNEQKTPVYREQDNDGANDCATAACTYPSITTAAQTITVSGTCDGYDQTTNCSDLGDIRVAVGASLESQLDSQGGGGPGGTDGTFSIASVPKPSPNAIVTVFVDGAPATASNRAIAITKYDGSGSISGLQLFKEHLTIGSADTAATLTSAELGSYDNSVAAGDDDVFHDYRTDWSNNNLTATGAAVVGLQLDCDSPATTCNTFSTQEELYIKSGWTYRPDSVGSDVVATHDLENLGTLNIDNNVATVTGSWLNSGTVSKTAGADVVFTSTTSETITPGTSSNFANITFNGTGGVWTVSTNAMTVDETLTMTAGQLAGTQNITVVQDVDGTAGTINLTGGTFKQEVAGTETFGPSTANTDWVFNNLTFARASGTAVIDTILCSDCDVTVVGVLALSESGDGAGTTLQAGDKTWHLTNPDQANPFDNDGQAADAGTLTAETSTFAYEGDVNSGDVAIENATYNNLQLTSDGVAENYDAAGTSSVSATLTTGSNATLIGTDNWTFKNVTSNGAITLTGGTSTFSTSGTINGSGSRTFFTGSVSAGATVNFNSSTTFSDNLTNTTTGVITYSSGTPTMTVNGTGTICGGNASGCVFYNLTFGGTTATIGTNGFAVHNNLNLPSSSIAAGTTTVTMGSGAIAGTITGGTAATLANLTISNTSNTVFIGGSNDITVNTVLTVSSTASLTIISGRTLILSRNNASNSLVMTGGTINGPGRLTYQNATTTQPGFPSDGTIAAGLIVRYDVTNGAMTTRGRSDYGTVELYNNSGTLRTVTLGTGTHTLTGDFKLIRNAVGGINASGSTNNPIFNIAGSIIYTGAGDLYISSGTSTWTVSGDLDIDDCDGSCNTYFQDLILNGTAKTIQTDTIGGASYDILTIDGTYTKTVNGPIYIAALVVNTGKSLTINSGQVVDTLAGGSVTINGTGTIDGAGTLIVNHSSLSTGGTLSSIVRFRVTNGDVSVPGRIYGGRVEVKMDNTATVDRAANCADASTITLSGASSYLYLINDDDQNLTLNCDTATDPTVSIGGNIDFTGTGAGNDVIISGAGAWTVGGDIDLTASGGGAGTYTATSGNTLEMTGTSKTLTSAGNALHHFKVSAGTVSASGATTLNGDMLITGGSFTAPAAAFNIAGNWTNSGGTFVEGTGKVTLNGTTSKTLNSGCANTDTCTNENFYDLEINKTDVADANDNVTLTTNGIRVTNTLTITDGELIQGALNVRAEGSTAVSIAAAGKWSNISTGDIKLGGSASVASGGVWYLDVQGNNDGCAGGDTDDITLTTTDGATQRTISGAGTFTFYDVSVSYMNGSGVVTVNGGTNVSNNTGITFNGCGITISGICKANDQSTNCTDLGTIKVAFGASLQAETDPAGGDGGTWSIATSTTPSNGAIITVFVDGAGSAADRSVGITKYSSPGDILNMVLYKEHLAIGSDDNATLTSAELGSYDHSVSVNDDDVFHDYDTDFADSSCAANSGGSTTCLKVDYTDLLTQEELFIKGSNTYQPGTGGSQFIATHDVEVDGTLDLTGTGNTLRFNGGWTTGGSATFTAGTSTVIATATSGTESLDTVAGAAQPFNALTLGETSGTATWNLTSALDVNGTLTLDRGTLGMNGSNTINTAGNVAINANGLYTKGSGAWTFDGTGTNTWTDNTSGQDLGLVTIDGTTKTVTLGSSVKAEKLTVTDTLDLAGSGYTLALTGTGQAGSKPLTVTGTFDTDSSSTVDYTGSSATDITRLTYYNLGVKPGSAGISHHAEGGGTLTVSGSLTVGNGANTGTFNLDTNDPTVTVAGSVTIAASGTLVASGTNGLNVGVNWTNSGTFTATTGSTVTFNGVDPQTITHASQSFYNLTINNTGTDGTDDDVEPSSGTVDINNDFNITNGDFDMTVGDPSLTVAHDVTIGSSAFVTKPDTGSPTWTFDGTTAATYTDNVATKQDIGLVIFNKTSGVGAQDKVTLASSMTVSKADIQTGDTLDISGDTLKLTGSGLTTARPLIESGTLTTDGTSIVLYAGTGAIDIEENITYPNLEMKPPSGSPTYTWGNYLGGSSTVNGNLTVGDGNTVVVNPNYEATFDFNGNVTIAANATFGGNGANGYPVGGNWDNNGTFNHNSAFIDFDASDTDNTIEAGSSQFYTINFIGGDGSGTWTFQTDDAIVAQTLSVDTSDIVSIAASRTVSATLNTTLNGTISGDGTLRFTDTSTGPGTNGTLSSIVRYDATTNDIAAATFDARTYGGKVELYSNKATAANVNCVDITNYVISGASSHLHLIVANTGNLSLLCDTATNDPAFTIGGDLDYVGTGSGQESITTGNDTWTVSGHVNLEDNQGSPQAGLLTATAGHTLTMDGASKTLTTNGQTYFNLNFTGSGTTTLTGAIIAAGDVALNGTIAAGTLTMTGTGNDDELTGGTATLTNLTIDPSSAATITLQTSNLTVTTALTVATGDTLSIISGIVLTAGTTKVNNDGTISGAGTLRFIITSGGPDTDANSTGSYASIVRYDATGGDIPTGTFDARTYNGRVELYSSHTALRTVNCADNVSYTLSGASSNLYLQADGTGNLALACDTTTDPATRFTIGGDLDYVGTNATGVESITAGPSIWSVAGNVNLQDNQGSPQAGVFTIPTTHTLTMTGTTKTLTAAGNSLYNLITSGTVTISGATTVSNDVTISGGTLTAPSAATLTVGHDFINNAAFTHNSGTVLMSSTGGNINGSADTTFSALTISSGGNAVITVGGSEDPTVSGVLTVASSDTLTIGASRVLTNTSATDANNDGTINGAGTLVFTNVSGGPDSDANSTGSYASIVRFDATAGDIATTTFDARTYGGLVELYSNSTSNRTVTFAGSTYTISGALNPRADNNGDVFVDGGTNSPTVNLTGDLDFTGTGNGTEVLAAGDGTWTVSGNVNFTDGIFGPQLATPTQSTPIWDDSAAKDESLDIGCGVLSTTYSCTGTTTNNLGVNLSGDCEFETVTRITSSIGLEYDLSGINDSATITQVQFNPYVSAGIGNPVFGLASGTEDLQSENCSIANGVYDKLATSNYDTGSLASIGTKIVDLGKTAIDDVDARIDAGEKFNLAINATSGVGSLHSDSNSVGKPMLRVSYAVATTSTLVMNGTSKTLTSAGNHLYNLSLSGTITLASTTLTIDGNLDMTGGDVTPGTSTVVMAGAGKTITAPAAGDSLYQLTIDPQTAGTVTLSAGGGNLILTNPMTVASGDTFSIGSGRTFTYIHSSNISLGGTISGAGTLIFTNTAGGPSSAGTLSSQVRFDATDGNVGAGTVDARTYGGAVEFYENSASARTITFPTSGTFIFSGAVTTTSSGGSTLDVVMDAGTDPTVTVSGALTIGANSTLIAPSSTTLTLNGNYLNNGTFTDSGSTVLLSGLGQQDVSGTLTGTSDFNNLTVTNDFGNGTSTWSVTFAGDAAVAGTFTATTANTKLRFNATSTYTFVNITLNGQAPGSRVIIRSSSTGTQWNLTSTGTQSVSNTTVGDSNACGGDTIDASDGTNQDEGNNSCWLINTLSLTLSATNVNLGTLSASQVNQGFVTTTITTSAASGYVSLVKYNQTLTSGSNTIADTFGGSISSGDNEFGASTDDTTSVDLATSSNSCVTGAGPMNATALSTTFKVYASSSAAASSAATKLCLVSSTPTTKEAGTYQSTITVVTTARF